MKVYDTPSTIGDKFYQTCAATGTPMHVKGRILKVDLCSTTAFESRPDDVKITKARSKRTYIYSALNNPVAKAGRIVITNHGAPQYLLQPLVASPDTRFEIVGPPNLNEKPSITDSGRLGHTLAQTYDNMVNRGWFICKRCANSGRHEVIDPAKPHSVCSEISSASLKLITDNPEVVEGLILIPGCGPYNAYYCKGNVFVERHLVSIQYVNRPNEPIEL